MSLRVSSHAYTEERAVILADIRDQVKGGAEAAFDGLPSFLPQRGVCCVGLWWVGGKEGGREW